MSFQINLTFPLSRMTLMVPWNEGVLSVIHDLLDLKVSYD